MKSRSCWLIFTLIGLTLTSCGQQKSSQEIAETVKNSIVLISYQNEGGHGTGFIVSGPTGVCTVLTARHVVEGRSLNLQTNDQKLHKTDSIQANPNLDLAVVTFPSADKNCPYPSLELGDSDSMKQTDQIYISGFPDRAGGGKLVRQFVRGSVSGLDVLEQGYGISYDASTFGGMSGGPVLDVRGKVVAIHGKTDAQIVADLQSQQASLSEQQKATLQQAAARVQGGVQVNTFRWGIPIKTYLANLVLVPTFRKSHEIWESPYHRQTPVDDPPTPGLEPTPEPTPIQTPGLKEPTPEPTPEVTPEPPETPEVEPQGTPEVTGR